MKTMNRSLERNTHISGVHLVAFTVCFGFCSGMYHLFRPVLRLQHNSRHCIHRAAHVHLVLKLSSMLLFIITSQVLIRNGLSREKDVSTSQHTYTEERTVDTRNRSNHQRTGSIIVWHGWSSRRLLTKILHFQALAWLQYKYTRTQEM